MPTVTQLCNLALGRVGHADLIGDPFDTNDHSRAAIACRNAYPIARDGTLEAGWWPFALGRERLAGLSRTRDPWAFAYALPHDCLVPRELLRPQGALPAWVATSEVLSLPPIPFALELSAGTRVLLTDEPAAELVYTVRVEDPTLFPPLFADALAWRLAADLATTLRGEAGLRNDCLAAWRSFVELAQVSAANTGIERPRPLPAAIRARR